MAILMKRSSSPFYYIRFQAEGKDRWISTKETNRKEAEKVMSRILSQTRDEISIDEQVRILGDLIAKLPKDLQAGKREEVVRAIQAGQERKIAIGDAWERWVSGSNKEYDPKPKTIQGYQSIWNRFSGWATQNDLKHLHDVDFADAEGYAAELWKSKVSASTYNQHIKFLRSLFLSLEMEAGIVANPWTRIVSTKKTLSGGRRNLTLDELQIILAKAEGNLRHLFIIGLFTGLRLADVLNLRVENIENNPFPPDTGPRLKCLVVKPKKTERVNKIIEVPLHATVAALLRELKEQRKEGFLFPKEQAIHARDSGRITVLIQAFFEGCGIRTKEEGEKGQRRRAIVRVGFHSLRHTFVSLCAKAGAPLHIVQKLVGHGNPMLTGDKYLHVDKADKQTAIENLPSFDGGNYHQSGKASDIQRQVEQNIQPI